MNETIVKPEMPRAHWMRALNFGRWLVVTAVYALAAPWLVVAVVGMVAWLAGVTVDDVRENVVGMATIGGSGWVEAAKGWNSYVNMMMLLAVGLRVGISSFVHEMINRAGLISDAWYKRQFPAAKVDAGAALSICATSVFGFLVVISWSGPQPLLGKEVEGQIAAMPAPHSLETSVALQLKGGDIISGPAEATRNADGTYLVKFK